MVIAASPLRKRPKAASIASGSSRHCREICPRKHRGCSRRRPRGSGRRARHTAARTWVESRLRVRADRARPVPVRRSAGPAPIPIVGMGTSAVIFAARSRGMHSSTIANAPASATARASAKICLAGSLNFVTAQPPDRLRRQANMPHHRDLRLDQSPDGRGDLATSLELDRLAVGLLEDPAGRPQCLPRRDLITQKR